MFGAGAADSFGGAASLVMIRLAGWGGDPESEEDFEATVQRAEAPRRRGSRWATRTTTRTPATTTMTGSTRAVRRTSRRSSLLQSMTLLFELHRVLEHVAVVPRCGLRTPRLRPVSGRHDRAGPHRPRIVTSVTRRARDFLGHDPGQAQGTGDADVAPRARRRPRGGARKASATRIAVRRRLSDMRPVRRDRVATVRARSQLVWKSASTRAQRTRRRSRCAALRRRRT